MKTVSVKVTLINGAVHRFEDCSILEVTRNEYVLHLSGDLELRIPMTSVLFIEEHKSWG